MAMSNCKECGKAVSTLAKTCPNCGVPKPATKSKIKKKTVSKKSISRDIIPNIKTSEYSNESTSSSAKSKNTEPGDTLDKFTDGDLDLPTAFWGFGFFASIIVGIVCGVLAEVVGTFFNFVYVFVTAFIIGCLWKCAENYKKIM